MTRSVNPTTGSVIKLCGKQKADEIEKLNRILAIMGTAMVLLSAFNALAPQAKAQSIEELYSLPAGAKRPPAQDIQYNPPILAHLSPQVVYASPGQTVSFEISYQTWTPPEMGTPTVVWQLFAVVSWTPSWPPRSGFYVPFYDGIPGRHPGISETESFSVTAPSEPGTYYIYFCCSQHYSMSQAVSECISPMSLPAHVKIIVDRSIGQHSIKIVNVDRPSMLTTGESFTLGVTIEYSFSILTGVSIQVYEHAGPGLGEIKDSLSGKGSRTYPFTLVAPSGPGTWQLNIHTFYWLASEMIQDDVKSVHIPVEERPPPPPITDLTETTSPTAGLTTTTTTPSTDRTETITSITPSTTTVFTTTSTAPSPNPVIMRDIDILSLAAIAASVAAATSIGIYLLLQRRRPIIAYRPVWRTRASDEKFIKDFAGTKARIEEFERKHGIDLSAARTPQDLVNRTRGERNSGKS